MSAHSQAPWSWSAGRHADENLVGKDGRIIASFYWPAGKERLNDRNLIKASPDLLAALKQLRDWYQENTGLPACAANAAIAKAEGGAG